MTLDDLNKLNSEATDLDSKAYHVETSSNLLGAIKNDEMGLFAQIYGDKSILRNKGWTMNQSHELLIDEIKKVVNEHAPELLGIVERRLAAKHLDLTQRAAMKRALLTASITPVEVSSD